MSIELPLRVPGKIFIPDCSPDGVEIEVGQDVGWVTREITDWKSHARFVSKRALLESEPEVAELLPEALIDGARYPHVLAAARACKVVVLETAEDESDLPYGQEIYASEITNYELYYHRVSDGYSLSKDGRDPIQGVVFDLFPKGAPAAHSAERALDRLLRAYCGADFTASSVSLAYELYATLNELNGRTIVEWEHELSALRVPPNLDELLAAIQAGESKEIAPGWLLQFGVLGAIKEPFHLPAEPVSMIKT